MKLLLAVFAAGVVLSAADPKVAARPAVAPRLTVPKGAVETEPGTFHYTDGQGKKWIYRTTPFGIARLADVPDKKPAALSDPGDGTTASADGDTIHFERPGPFGTYRWQKNKADLNETEQAVWNRTLSNQSPAKNAAR